MTAWVEDRLDAVWCPAFDDGVGDDPAEEGVDGRFVATRRELDAPPGCRGGDGDAELGRGVDDRVGGAVGDTRMEGDLDRASSSSPGTSHVAVCNRGSTRKPARQVALLGVEIALDEGDVADRDGARQVDVVGRRGGDDRRLSRVVTDCLDGQSRPGWHCSDPTTPIA